MENSPESTSLLAKISEYLGVIIAIAGSIGVVFGYFKYLHGKMRNTKNTVKAFINIPTVLAEIQHEQGLVRAELVFESNLSLRQKLSEVGENLKLLKDVFTIEINTRRAMFRHAEIAYFETDNQGNCIWVNQAYEDLCDRSLDDVKGKGWRSHILDVDRYKVIKEWERAVEEKRDFTMRFQYSTRKGDFLVITNAVAIKDDLDNLLSYVGTVKKIEH